MSVQYFTKENGQKLAYVHVPATESGAALPPIMFLGGFKSDMQGSKAQFLQAQCEARGQEFVRFDYRGHGQSDAEFVDGTIGDWMEDAADILANILPPRPVVLVGSSMGGWISLLLLLSHPQRVHGVVGIASAPDFTAEIEEGMGEQEHKQMNETGRLVIPSEYEEPYIFTRDLILDGANRCILGSEHDASLPMVLLQGKQDAQVPWEKAHRIQRAFPKSEVDVIFIDDGNHSLSRPQDLTLIDQAVLKLSSVN